MNKQIAVKTREKWVDDVKVIACILVVLGHFFQSMVKASIMPERLGKSTIFKQIKETKEKTRQRFAGIRNVLGNKSGKKIYIIR